MVRMEGEGEQLTSFLRCIEVYEPKSPFEVVCCSPTLRTSVPRRAQCIPPRYLPISATVGCQRTGHYKGGRDSWSG